MCFWGYLGSPFAEGGKNGGGVGWEGERREGGGDIMFASFDGRAWVLGGRGREKSPAILLSVFLLPFPLPLRKIFLHFYHTGTERGIFISIPVSDAVPPH